MGKESADDQIGEKNNGKQENQRVRVSKLKP